MDLNDLKREADSGSSSDDPIDRLSSAVAVARRVSALGDELIDHYVEAARAAGCSWAQVGEALGVTRQAAQQRQKGLVGRIADKLGDRGLFARFTDRARTAVVTAQEAARERGHTYIGTEHLLIGLVRREDGIAVEALARCGATRQSVEAAVDARIERGAGAPAGHIPFTARSKKALEMALREAQGLGHNYLGTEHVLLALAAGDGVAADVLADLGIDHARAKAEVVAVLTSRS